MSKLVDTISKSVLPVIAKLGPKAPVIGVLALATGGAGLGGFFVIRHNRKKRMERSLSDSRWAKNTKEDK